VTNSPKTSRKFDQSESRPYKSHFKEGYICAADYICELVFKKRASISKSGVPQSFWNSDDFKKQYVAQAIHARRLLKTYHPTVIIRAFEDTPFCLSLSNAKLTPLLKRYQSEFEAVKRELVVEDTKVELPRKQINTGKNKLGDL